MSEITKLYENAGIEPERQDCCKIADKYWASNTESGFEYLMQKECPYNQECTDECEYAYDKVVYPPFTAEKQLELIKLLGNIRDYTVEIDKFKGVYYVGCCSAGSNDKLWGSSNVFEDALAELINETWFCFTAEEKQQVKGILE